jgi:CheY-like chemotaxis protein
MANERSSVILCIEDQPAALELRKALLERAGYTVIPATDGAEGLGLFRAKPIDLVVVDYFLPGLTGTQVAAQMKRLKHDVPIVLVSGITESPEGLENVDLFVTKLELPALFLAEVAALLATARNQVA